jgi:predicted alpha/beta-hydrolase family hydrolase
MSAVELDTPHGPARAHLRHAEEPRAALVFGHGAGGGVEAPDIQAAAKVALEGNVTHALVEQPYRVAGRKSPAPAKQLDAAWSAVVEQIFQSELAGLPYVAGGRSLGARVACRTAASLGAVAVLCLAFPLHPPGRPESSRLSELDAVDVPMLVVQGTGDPFGMPPEGPRRVVAQVAGNHGLKSDLDAVASAVREWLPTVVPERARA